MTAIKSIVRQWCQVCRMSIPAGTAYVVVDDYPCHLGCEGLALRQRVLSNKFSDMNGDDAA